MKLSTCLCLLIVMGVCQRGLGKAMQPNDNAFDRTCNYTAKGVSSKLFRDGSDFHFLFPLENRSPALHLHDKPWQACFGPEEEYEIELIKQGKKLPCAYSDSDDGTINYWEEHACEMSLKSNCYCYAVDRYVGSFCQPGLGTLKARPKMSCDSYIKAVIADGGVKVDRKTVYSKPSKGHYIALAVMPPSHHDTGDFHFWRLDSDGVWSGKPGMAMPRRTYRNGTLITDVEAPETRGDYTQFCGYFDVDPDSMKVQGVGDWWGVIPERIQAWSKAGLSAASLVLPRPTPGWMLAYKWYWEIPVFRPATEASRAASRVAGDLYMYRRSAIPRGAFPAESP